MNQTQASFVPALLVELRKRLTEDIFGEINEMIIAYNESACSLQLRRYYDKISTIFHMHSDIDEIYSQRWKRDRYESIEKTAERNKRERWQMRIRFS